MTGPILSVRDEAWSRLEEPWDLVVIGGGITGAGILAEATRMGHKAVLLEGGDFASGTSSRSSKLVHGGMRYLKQAQVGLTLESVRERDRLLHDAPGLVDRLPFLLTSFQGDRTPPWVFALGVMIYDVIARSWDHDRVERPALLVRAPALAGSRALHAYRFHDAQTDDARLVLRILGGAVRLGAVALNHVRATQLLRDQAGRVVGVAAVDQAGSGRTAEVRGRVVVNATGAWADHLREQVGGTRRLRVIRGSHLVFSGTRLSLPAAISMVHPRDNRAVFAIPWEGVTLVGTTDVDHHHSLASEPVISAEEVDYLLELTHFAFPTLELGLRDVLTTWAGVRPVIDTGAANPSKESREHAIWQETGLLTVTGGKLTTFGSMARHALRKARHDLPGRVRIRPRALAELDEATASQLAGLPPSLARRLLGRHGPAAGAVLACGDPTQRIGQSPALWSELRWAARSEAVVHLEDLLLRRVRLGLLLPGGGLEQLEQIRQVAQPELGWDDERWAKEERAYREKMAAMSPSAAR